MKKLLKLCFIEPDALCFLGTEAYLKLQLVLLPFSTMIGRPHWYWMNCMVAVESSDDEFRQSF
jgi:hypothetical protein